MPPARAAAAVIAAAAKSAGFGLLIGPGPCGAGPRIPGTRTIVAQAPACRPPDHRSNISPPSIGRVAIPAAPMCALWPAGPHRPAGPAATGAAAS